MADTKKNIQAALKQLKEDKARLERSIRELIAARAQRTRVVAAIRDLEHALKTIMGGKKPGPKPKAKKKVAGKPKAKRKKVARKKPGPKPKKTRKKSKKTSKKKTDRSKAWTPAKRAAMRKKVKAYWARKKAAEKKAG